MMRYSIRHVQGEKQAKGTPKRRVGKKARTAFSVMKVDQV